MKKSLRAKKNLGIIKHLSIFLPRKTLDQMYKALVRSHFDYCDIIYHIPSLQTQLDVCLTDLMEKAERIQYQAALAITGAWQGSSRSKLYEELGSAAVFKFWGTGPFFICGVLRVNVENSWGLGALSGGGELKMFRF